MQDVKQQENEDIDLKPIPLDQDMKNTDDDGGLIPLPIESNDTNHFNDDNDTEMKDLSNEETQAMIVEEVEEEEGCIIEEEEESGDIIMPPPQPTQEEKPTETSSSAPKPQPKTPKEQDKDRARSHPITTNTVDSPRYLNIHLMKEWTNAEVLGWLTHRFGLWGQQYVPVFSNKKVDGAQLAQLTEGELKTEFGVTKPLHLIRMIRDINDAALSIHQINQLIAPSYMDGGSAASKMMRFGSKEVCAFSQKVNGLKMHAQTFLDRQINGRVLLECSDGQLVTAMKNDQITLVDAQSILDIMGMIKKEESMNPDESRNNAAINAVYEVWNDLCKLNEIRFKLLPQHIRDYTKPAPTYYPPPQHRLHKYGQNAYNHDTRRRPSYRIPNNDDDDGSGNPPLYKLKSVTEWNTQDCITWLGQIRESKVDLRVRYTPHFEQIKMTGPILLNMTPSTLSAICCITTKTHLKQLVKAIDKIRDHLVFNGFGQQDHVKEFITKYGGGYNFPTTTLRYDGAYDNVKKQNEREQVYAQQQQQQQQQQQPQPQPQQPQQQPQRQQNANGNGNDNDNDTLAAKCFVCGKTGNVMRCSQCKSAFYCSREHQISDWGRHSKECQKS